MLSEEGAVPEDPVAQQIRALFQKTPVVQMPQIERALAPRSRRSLFRDLAELGYLSSYTHTGRYYTLVSVPEFDADGLWRYQGIGFSRDGTLKATVQRLVRASDAGRTQHELQLRMGVRVHNPLLDLVEDRKLGRQSIEDEYVYVAAERARATVQIERRRALVTASVASAPPTGAIEVEVLIEVIHGARVPPPDAATVAARLDARGIRTDVREVAGVLARHGLGEKKTVPSRSPRSRR
jgi:hypothetical protein